MGLLDLQSNPCSQLNSTTFPNIWLKSDRPQGEAYRQIASSGTLLTFTSKTTGISSDGNMLNSLSPSSSYRLINFLSNGENTKLNNILIKKSNKIGLVDAYIVPALGSTSYTFSSSSTPLLPQNKIWSSDDETKLVSQTGGTIPTSILGLLLSEGVLLKKSELYDPNPTQGAQPTLIEIYKRIQAGEASSDIQVRKTTLETKNIKFFASFLAEYCFYKSRYTYMLKEFFTLFNATGTAVTISTTIKESIGATSTTKEAALTAMTNILAQLNTRMNDMLRLLNALNEYYSNILTQVSNDINSTTSAFGSNRALEDAITALRSSEQGINSNLSEADFKKEAVRYMNEKNRYGNTLLGLYAFLNLSALAILYKVYKS
jgi:hypothetical protein